jgi:hypothetical protein
MTGRREAACLGDDFVNAFIEIERAIDARVVAFGHQRVDFQSVALGIEKITRDGVAHFFIGMAYAARRYGR